MHIVDHHNVHTNIHVTLEEHVLALECASESAKKENSNPEKRMDIRIEGLKKRMDIV